MPKTERRGNQDRETLRRVYLETTPEERLARGMRISRFGSKLRAAGRRARGR